MSESSHKRSTSPLSPQFDKKLRFILADEVINELNDHLRQWVQLLHADYAVSRPENITTALLAITCREVVINLLNETHALSMDKSWMKMNDGEARINGLSPEDRLQLASTWVEARRNGDWEKFAIQPLLQVEPHTTMPTSYTRHVEDQITATEKSWERPFKGDATIGLLHHIESHYNPLDSRLYAHFAAIVQSSGMGKSRTVDELAKNLFVVPLNLRAATSTGYPPADPAVRDYLSTSGSKNIAFNRSSVFLQALFENTNDFLRDVRGPDYTATAKLFRTKMTVGQHMKGHNQHRRDFYNRVIERASLLERQSNDALSSPSAKQEFPPYVAFEGLCKVLPEGRGIRQSQRNLKQKADRPSVILAFDEVDTITQRQQTGDQEWSVFNELRHALRRLRGLPLFALFLSTTGNVSEFTSAMGEDLSKRVADGELDIIQPFTDLGFDPLAYPIAADGSWDLEQLTDDSQMCSQGRPLFASDGSGSVKREIIQFAVAKLLNADYTTVELSLDQELACLSQRLPIEFNSTNYTSQQKERKQVEEHMRVCLKIGAVFETMTTTSSSEPILSEAAYFLMQRGKFNAPVALKSAMEGFSISKGDRGEFLGLLLLTLARDLTVGAPDEFGRPVAGKRWFGLTDFLYGQLFRKQTKEASWVDANSISALSMLPVDFPNAQLHFNHFVKVHELKAIEMERLLLFKGRGAAVLCGNSQNAVDSINVFLKDGTKLVEENGGLMFQQWKNDSRYTETPQQKLYDAMDPYDLGILKQGDPAVPLIKVVFALAAKKPSLKVVRHVPTEDYPAVVYEIWCAGISPDILGPIKRQEVGIWQSLLQASYGWKDLYRTTSVVTADLRRSAAPGAARDAGHYSCWATLS